MNSLIYYQVVYIYKYKCTLNNSSNLFSIIIEMSGWYPQCSA